MPLDGAYSNALLLLNWSIRQKRNHVRSVIRAFCFSRVCMPIKNKKTTSILRYHV